VCCAILHCVLGDSVAKLPRAPIRLLEPFHMHCYRLHLRVYLVSSYLYYNPSSLFRPHQRYTALHKEMSRVRPKTVYPWWRRGVLPPSLDRLFLTPQQPSNVFSILYYFLKVKLKILLNDNQHQEFEYHM